MDQIQSAELAASIVALLAENKGKELSVTRPIKNPKYKDMELVVSCAEARSLLIKEHDIIMNIYSDRIVARKANQMGGSKTINGADFDESKLTSHTYHLPPFHNRIKSLLLDTVPHNIWIHGPTGSGKTQYVHKLATELGMEKYKKPLPVIQINGRQDMDSSSFLGDKTIEVDIHSKQNHIVFKDGPVVKAMQTGLDSNNKPIEGEAPAILFIDETAALPSHIMIALNRLLETCTKERKITLDNDGGREIHSHPNFRIICAANTLGRGSMSNSDVLYTAQADALDISTLNRFSATFKFGYNKEAEKKILEEKIPDSRAINQIIKFRDAIRASIKAGKISSPFTTRDIVSIADLYRVWGSISDTLYYGVMNRLPNDEMTVYNEIGLTVLGRDILKDVSYNTNIFDYMD